MSTPGRKTLFRNASSRSPARLVCLGAICAATAACTDRQIPVDVNFAPVWGETPIACDSAPLALTDLRFYVADVAVIDSSGKEHAVEIASKAPWQLPDVTLIDLEDAAAACLNGSEERNATLSGSTAAPDIAGLQFTLGVPFELNHQNPLLATAPLDQSAMHWHWRSGYKFLRAGVRTANGSFSLHLGSTACEGTVQAISGCGAPNRVLVKLPEFRADRSQVDVDLAALFNGVTLADGLSGECSSGPAESQCAAPFAALGLAFGPENDKGDEQTVFRSRP